MARERLINPSVHAFSPELRWHAESDEWIALGFEVVEGRSSDFGPNSGDLGAVVGLLDGLRGVPLPIEAGDWQETRWDRFAPEGTTEFFRGDTLLFTDVNPDNFVIGERRSWIVDWSMPTRGAGFIDPACLVVQLLAAGHSAEQAEEWAARCKGWVDADASAIDAFAMATLRMNKRQAERFPEAEWLGAMAEAAETWAGHRGVADPVPHGAGY
ncbi:protein kinase [Streptomyces zingiberis]|nr:protein kinase [Streptomyces zingiberis]